ncbi:MAG: hypothetical protein ACRD40_05835 [Candidatus Acidiferrales bacterium]
MDSLMEALQAPPAAKPETEEHELAEREPEESAEERASEWHSFNAPAANEEPSGSLPSIAFAGGDASRWKRSTKAPLDYEGNAYWNESWSDRLVGHAPVIVVALLFASAIGTLFFFYRAQVGNALIGLGEKMSGGPTAKSAVAAPPNPPAEPPPQPASSTPPSLSAGGETATSSVPDANSTTESSTNRFSSNSAKPEPQDHAQQAPHENATAGTSQSLGDGEAEYEVAHASLGAAHTPDAKARAAELLWAAVAKGSSDAEIELADVYGRGEGVRRNCQQARILLAAARDKHNPLAEKEGSELRVYGCR